jgi:two-component system, OmpR family, phosphate regulon sensor histidine kinase PhoR
MRKRRKLIWQLYPSYLIIIILSLAAVGWYATNSLRQFYLQKTAEDLRVRALLVATLAKERLTPEKAHQLDAVSKKVGSETTTRITIILPSGRVIGDSDFDPSVMTNHADRPEIQAVLDGKVGYSTRHSYTSKKDTVYVAVPAKRGDKLMAVVRAAMPAEVIRTTLQSIYWDIAAAGLVIALFAALVNYLISRRLTGSIEEMKQGAERFASGNLLFRLGGGSSEEMSALAEAMNRMAEQLRERLVTITSQRNELEAVLYGMMEAVLVVDTDERIIRMNKAAEKLFQVDADAALGRTLQEAVRNADLQRFVERTLSGTGSEEGDLEVPGEPDRFIQAHGSILNDVEGGCMGAVVVLNDVTRLKTLETIRKDFVANVSHELKTPVTSIKGFLETLMDGAIKEPKNAERFLDIMMKQTDRLSMIIEDLLSLSRIEQASEEGSILLEKSSPADVIETVKKACWERAKEKGIALVSECDSSIAVGMNPTLLEQALSNLVDNAVKYSDPQRTVKITCAGSDNEVVIRVEDQGRGIAKEHQARIFERFYRVDKARSRQVGGTGLGLAIVKHIVNAHGGVVTVESTPEQGSTFSIHLPTT